MGTKVWASAAAGGFLVLVLVALLFGRSGAPASSSTGSSPAPSAGQSAAATDTDPAWRTVGARVYLDSQQAVNAQKVGNRSDLAIALQSLQKECHNAEPLQYHPGKTAGQTEQQIGQVCASAGFPLTPLP